MLNQIPPELIIEIDKYFKYVNNKIGFYRCCKWIKIVYDSNKLFDRCEWKKDIDWDFVKNNDCTKVIGIKDNKTIDNDIKDLTFITHLDLQLS